MKISYRAISNVTATVIVIIVLIIGAGGTYYFVSSTVSAKTVTSVSSTTSTVTSSVTSTSSVISTSTSVATSTITSTTSVSLTSTTSQVNYNIDPHPTQIVEDVAGGPQYVDPSIDYETAGSNVIQNVNEQLMWFKGADATAVVPWLASSQTISPDGLTYTYQLRQGIKFSDGTPFNASAVYFSVMRTIIIDDPSSPAWAVDQVLRGAYNYSESYGNQYGGGGTGYDQRAVNALVALAPVTIDGPYTVSFHLIHPYAAWPFIMAFSVTAVQDPTAVIAHWVVPTNSSTGVLPANAGGDGLPRGGATAGDYSDAQNPYAAAHTVGTGPYELQSWDQATGDYTLVANPNYWGGPDGSIHPTIQTVVVKNIADSTTRELDLKSGAADLSGIPIATGQIFDFINQTRWFATHTMQETFPGVSMFGPFAEFETDFIGMDQTRMSATGTLLSFQPFKDPKVREAMAYLWDDATYISEVEKGFSPTATQILPPGMFGFNSSIAPITLNTTIAQKLLLAAGPADGFGPNNPQTINIYYNTGSAARQDAAIILASNINSIASVTGLYANIVTVPWPQFLSAVETHQADVWNLGWIVDYVDPDDFLVPFASGTSGTYALWSGFNNQTITSWVVQQATISNPTARAALIDKIEMAINNGHYYLWTLNGVNIPQGRSWIEQKPNAYITSNYGTQYCTALYGYYYAEIQPTAT